MDWFLNALWSITPTVIIGGLFGLIIYAAMNADRKIRKERAQVELEERAKLGLPPRQETAG